MFAAGKVTNYGVVVDELKVFVVVTRMRGWYRSIYIQLEEALEVKSLRCIISAYLKYV